MSSLLDSSWRRLASHPVLARLTELAGGTPVHLVGGAVRDELLGRPSGDFDLVVAGGGERLAEAVTTMLGGRLVRLGGERFAAFRVVLPSGISLDLWDREGASLEADLARRDLTVNAIALSLPGGSLVDPFGGLADLEAKRLVATTSESFRDDPLRVLRLARFAAELPGFHVPTPTLALARESAPRLSEVAAERIRYELERIFAAPNLGPARGLAILAHTDVYPGLWIGRPGEHLAHRGAPIRLARLARQVRALSRSLSALGFEVAPAGWAHSFETLREDHPGALTAFVERGWLLAKTGRIVERLLAEPEFPHSLVEARRFLDRWRERWPMAAAWLRGRGRAMAREAEDEQHIELLVKTFELFGPELLAPSRLLSGDEVRELLALPAGPKVGQALEKLRQAQVDGLVRTKDEAVRLLTEAADVL